MSQDSLCAADIDRLAHKRAATRLGWYIHATVYLLINLALVAVAAVSGRDLVTAPFFAWALALAIHGVVVWFAVPGASLYERLLQRELSRLQPQRDPW